jgi:5-methylcytosine-specific restriction protein A
VISAAPVATPSCVPRVRTVPPALWDALVVRDRHCQAPGCDQPPENCEAHHVKPFAHGGRTSLNNVKLYCSQHHHNEHRNNPHLHRRE